MLIQGSSAKETFFRIFLIEKWFYKTEINEKISAVDYFIYIM